MNKKESRTSIEWVNDVNEKIFLTFLKDYKKYFIQVDCNRDRCCNKELQHLGLCFYVCLFGPNKMKARENLQTRSKVG